MSNTIINEAIKAHNEELAEQVQYRAVELVSRIGEKNSAIADALIRIAAHVAALEKINKDEITEASVLGGALPASANKETILKVIEAANKARQFGIEQSSKRLVDSITAEKAAIAAIEKQLTELRNELAGLKAPEVTVAEVTGS